MLTNGQSVPVAVTPTSIDPRDETWEVYDPAYRVHFWDSNAALDAWELVGCDVEDALAWAQKSAGTRTFTLYSVVKQPSEVGLIRLLGTDPTRARLPNTSPESPPTSRSWNDGP